MSADAALASMLTALRERGLDADTLALRSDGTLAASAQTLLAPDASSERAFAPSRERLEPGAVLGQGGMGIVRVAVQQSLRREVAMKTVRDPTHLAARDALLKEAWAAGSLEHPSIVPVHTLARHEDGVAVVMKRIEGDSWTAVLRDPRAHPRFAGPDALEAHLRVLVAVCHALELAHARGVVHLDLKPDNVMLGALGEVYVLDWGLACATAEGPAWLAPVSAIASPLGTPGYMAPELVVADTARIGPRTDVYLLGAMLHHVLTGSAPHDCEGGLVAVLLRAYASEPREYDEAVPAELAQLARTAMHADPAARFPTVAALREAIEAFLRHRGAEHVARRAAELEQEIDTRLSRRERDDPELEPLFAESEEAIASLRREWPEHPRLGAFEEGLLVRRTRHALDEERLPAARALLERFASPPPELAREIEALAVHLGAKADRVRSLEALSRELDLSLGSHVRRRVFAILASLWLLVSLVLGAVHRSGLAPFGYRELAIEGAVLVATLAPVAWLLRGTLFQNRANRRLYGGLIFTALAIELFWFAAMRLGLPHMTAVALTPLFYAYAFATLGVAVDRRMLGGAAVLLAGAAACALAPSYAYELVGLAGGASVAVILLGWRRASDTALTPEARS